MDWNENSIARALSHQALKGRNLIVIPRSGWTGYECDLLVVDDKLRIIDVEIKISRSDLKADAKKDKWWHRRPWDGREYPREHRNHPPRVFKHYYALPKDIWKPELLECIPPTSGVFLLSRRSWSHDGIVVDVLRRAKPNKEAKPISAADAIDLGRHASLRMWDALIYLDQVKAGRPRRIYRGD